MPAAKARIIVVEDERAQREPLARYLRSEGYEVDAAGAMTLALSREIEWGLDRGADLPLRFVVTP